MFDIIAVKGSGKRILLLHFLYARIRCGSVHEKTVTYVSFKQGSSEHSKALDKEFASCEHLYAHSRVSASVFSRA